MPGENCSVPGCGINRRETFSDIGNFQIPNRKREFYEKWRKDMTSCLLKYQEVDQKFKTRLENGNAYIFEQHFNLEKDIEFRSK